MIENMESKTKSEEIPAEVRAYMARMGSKKTPAKLEAIRANAVKASAARRLDPATVLCTCGGGDSVELADHKTTCPRGRLLYQRARNAAKKASSGA
jgi:hypothetical protein